MFQVAGAEDGRHGVFAGTQEQLAIRHSKADVPAVTTAVRRVIVPDLVGLIRGHDAVIGLTEPTR